MHRAELLILAYHDIFPTGFPEQNPLFGMTVESKEFDWQLDYLHEKYNPITFQQFVEWFNHGASIPRHAVLITIDDGHKNNLQHVLPLLKKRNTPAVCFVLAQNLGATKLLWFEEAYYRIMFSSKKSLTMRRDDHWSLEDAGQRSKTCGKLFSLFRTLSEDEQQEQLAHLRRQLPLEEGELQFRGRFEFLSSEDLRVLRQNNVEIAAHSLSHPILASLRAETVKREIVESKQRLEELQGVPVRAFAYPFGTWGLDFGVREMELVQQCGFYFGFTGESGFVGRDSDRFALPRISIGRMCHAHFASTVAGALSSLKTMVSVSS